MKKWLISPGVRTSKGVTEKICKGLERNRMRKPPIQKMKQFFSQNIDKKIFKSLYLFFLTSSLFTSSMLYEVCKICKMVVKCIPSFFKYAGFFGVQSEKYKQFFLGEVNWYKAL